MSRYDLSYCATLTQRVGTCVILAGRLCIFSREIHEVEAVERVIRHFDPRIALYRALSPCHCVLNRWQPACFRCPLSETVSRQAYIQDVNTIYHFLGLFHQWPEFLGENDNYTLATASGRVGFPLMPRLINVPDP